MTTEQRPYLGVLKALYDYEPTSDDEVAIKENQLLFLIEKTDDEYVKFAALFYPAERANVSISEGGGR